MIRLIFVQKSDIRDAFCRAFSLEKIETTPFFTSYQKWEWILIFSENRGLRDSLPDLLELYIPERVFLPFFGRSLDMTHEIGDVIFPNTFLSYDARIESADMGAENRDAFLGEARFLETFREQKDYYVEDFGLSVGGIVVDKVTNIENPEYDDKRVMAYEADIYISESLDESYETVVLDDATTLISCGIVSGKMPKNHVENPLDFTVRNMVTAWRLMEE